MEKIKLLICFLVQHFFLNPVISFQCYRCNGIDDKECQNTGYHIDCVNGESACAILKYEKLEDDIRKNETVRQCANALCDITCELLPKPSYMNCEVKCCFKNLCNAYLPETTASTSTMHANSTSNMQCQSEMTSIMATLVIFLLMTTEILQ